MSGGSVVCPPPRWSAPLGVSLARTGAGHWVWEWTCRPEEARRGEGPPHLPGSAVHPRNSGLTPKAVCGRCSVPGVAARVGKDSGVANLKIWGRAVAG